MSRKESPSAWLPLWRKIGFRNRRPTCSLRLSQTRFGRMSGSKPGLSKQEAQEGRTASSSLRSPSSPSLGSPDTAGSLRSSAETLLKLPFPWHPGEHLTLIGETGSGKSTVAKNLLSMRRYLLVIRTKSDDIEYPVQTVASRAGALNSLRYERIELRPNYEDQADEIYDAYELVYQQGGWTVYNDEEWYVEEILKLTAQVNKLLTQGRAKKVGGKVRPISMAMGAQRPSRISRFVLSQSTHVISFGVEGRDAKIVAEATTPAMQEAVASVNYAEHEFAWYHRPTRAIWRGRVQDLGGNP